MRNRNQQPAPLDLPPVDITPIRIYGQLIGPMQRPEAYVKILLKAITTTQQIVQDTWSECTADQSGNYDFSVNPGKYAVFFERSGIKTRVNNIHVYSDSAPGPLQTFMLSPAPELLTPLVVQEVKAALELASAAVLRSRQWAENPVDVPVLDFEQGAGPEYSSYHWAKKAAESAARSIGLNWRDDWSSTASYVINDAVFYAGSAWIAVAVNAGVTPVDGGTWNMLAQKGDTGAKGVNWRGLWSSAKAYNPMDGVQYLGDAWYCLEANQNITPMEGEHWTLFAQGGGANGDYLKIANNLSEIAANGEEGQAAARGFLGLGTSSLMDVQPDKDTPTSGTVPVNGWDAFFKKILLDSGDGTLETARSITLTLANGVFTFDFQGKINSNEEIYCAGNIEAGESISTIVGGVYEDAFETRVYSANNPPPQVTSGTLSSAAGSSNEPLPVGCVSAGQGENGVLYYRAQFHEVNQETYVTSLAEIQSERIHSMDISPVREEEQISELKKLIPYKNPLGFIKGLKKIICLIDEDGRDWYRWRKKLTGNYFIAYDPDTGIIRQVDKNVMCIWPVNLNVRGVDDLPEGCSADGTWIFDGSNIAQNLPGRTATARKLRDGFINATDILTTLDYTIHDAYLTEAQRQELFATRLNYKKWPATPGWPEIPLPAVPGWIMDDIGLRGYAAPVWPGQVS